MRYNFQVCGIEVDIEYTPGTKGYLGGLPIMCYPACAPMIELNHAIPVDKKEFEECTEFPYAFAKIWTELFPEEFAEQIELELEAVQESDWDDWHQSQFE